jgi:hypothetical protein
MYTLAPWDESKSAPCELAPSVIPKPKTGPRFTLEDLWTVSKDIINHYNGFIAILRSINIGLVPVDLLIRSLGGILSLDGREGAAC